MTPPGVEVDTVMDSVATGEMGNRGPHADRISHIRSKRENIFMQ
jgi:hypothetical protein